MKMTSKKLNKRIVGALIIALTTVYLLATAAIAQEASITAETTKLTYQRDYLSWGDVWSFDETAYNASLYKDQNGTQTYEYYNTSQDTTTSSLAKVQASGYKYYGTVTTSDKKAPTGTALNTYESVKFYSGISGKSDVEAPIGIDGVTIPVVTTGETGVYSVVPGAAGNYRIYVYSPDGAPTSVKYALLEDYTSNNSYETQMLTTRTFTQVGDTDWYYTELKVNNLSWSAYSLSVDNQMNSSTNNTSAADTGVGTFTGSVNTVLGNTTYYHFYNTWKADPRWYNTVLAIQFDSSVQLGPITKTGDSLTVTNAESEDGTITARNIFGEAVIFGTNYHMPVYITATPLGEKQFSGFEDGEGKPLTLMSYSQSTGTGTQTYYEYNFEETATLTSNWEKQVDFATVKVSGAKTATLHYYLNKADSHSFEYGIPTQYTFTADYTNAVEASVQYTVKQGTTVIQTGSLSADNPTLSVTAQWETMVVTFQSDYEGVEKTMTFTVAPSTTGKTAVAKIGNTMYYYLEDALEAAQSGNRVELLRDYTFLTTNRKSSWGDMNGGPGYTVKSGVTFIVPYATSYDYTTTTGNTDHTYACEGKDTAITGTGGSKPGDSNTYMTLTVPSGVTLKVASGGVMSVGGTTNGAELIIGPHADVYLQSGAAISVDGVLSSCGFIYGSGTVYGDNGSSIYVPFTVNDFRGGSYTVGAAGKLSSDYGITPVSGETAVTPFMRYSFQAIQCKQHIVYGCSVIAYADLYANSDHNNSRAEIVGKDANSCLIALAENSYLEITYDGSLYASTYPEVGKMYLTVYGNAAYGGMTLEVDTGVQKATVDTRKINFVLPYNFDLRIASGTFTLPNSIMLLPGASVIVDEGATLDVNGQLTVYDGLHDYTCGATEETTAILSQYADTEKYPGAKTMTPSRSYPSSAVLMGGPFYGSGSANLIVNGTLNLKSGASLGGVVQTSSTTGKAMINTDSNIGTSTKTQIGVTGYYSIDLWIVNYEYAFVGATVRELPGQILDTATGERINIQGGLTYYPSAGSDKIDSYKYDLYYYWTGTGSGAPNVKDTITENVNLILQGSWYNYEVPIYTVMNGQVSAEPIMTYFAHGTDVSDQGYYLDAGCTQPVTTVTSEAPLYYAGACEANVVWADGSGETYFPSVRNAVKAAVNQGDRVVVLVDLTDFDDIIGPIDTQDFIFDLNGHTLVCNGTVFTNHSETGNLTVDLHGGKVTNVSDGTQTSTSPILSLPAGNRMTLDLNGGTIEYCTNVTSTDTTDQAAAAIINGGDLVIKDTAGTGMITGGLTLDIKSVTPANYVSLIRNEYDGNLSLSNVNLKTTQNANDSNVSTVIFNGNGAVLDMENVKLESNDGYSVYNLGGVIRNIQGGSITGEYGIYNQNVRSGSQATEAGYQIDYEARIWDVSDVTIQVTQYGIYNQGSIGTIGGSTSITANTYAVYNDYKWYYDSYLNRYENTSTVNGTDRTYYSDLTEDFSGVTADKLIAGLKGEEGGIHITIPFIARITGSTSLNAASTSASGYALYTRGYIGEIIGNTSISAGYRYSMGVVEGGYVGLIGGSTTIYAKDRYALYINSQRNTEYTDCRDAAFSTQYAVKYSKYVPSRVEAINGSNVHITAGSGYAIQVNAELGSISGNVSIETPSYGIVVNGAGAIESRDYTRIRTDGVETDRKNVYQYAPAKIESIGASASDSVTITTTGTYGISNSGLIETIGPGATISSSKYAINNSTSRYDELTEEVSSAADVNAAGQYLTIYNRTYSHVAPTIEKIDGAEITSTSTYALRNYGHIETIRNATISSGANDYAVVNYADGSISGQRTTLQYYLGTSLFATTTSQFSATNTGTVSYAKPSIGSIENCTITAKMYGLYNGGEIGTITGNTITGSSTHAICNAGKPRSSIAYTVTEPAYDAATGKYTVTSTSTTAYTEQCTIDTIGAGNTIQATNYAIYNSGYIRTIDSGTGEKTRLLTTSTGLYNYRGLQLASGYTSAAIGTIKNTEIVGNAYGIRNGDGNASYPDVTIGELGEGLVAVATRSSGYAVFNTATNAEITLISGGDYYSGQKTRDSAIYLPDDQTYSDGYSLSTTTREATANGKTYNCYYITLAEHTHTYGDPEYVWEVDKETNTASVTATILCSECAEGTEGKTLSATVNNVVGILSAGDCQTKGGVTYSATVTLNGTDYTPEPYYVENESFGEHAPDEAVKENVVDATCTAGGSYDSVEYCSVCNAELSRVTMTDDATGHSYQVTDSTSADCETAGSTVHKCSACGDEYTEVIPATGHSWKKDTVAKEPTCTESGSQGYVCENNANHIKTEPIPATGHTYGEPTFQWAEDNSCSATYSCAASDDTRTVVCDVEAKETKPATENEAGEMTYTATVIIGETSYTDTKTATIPALGHSYTSEVTKDPTCTEKGERTYTCGNCDDTYTEDIDPLGHSWSEWEVTNATCTEDGKKTRTCTVGDATEEEVIPQTGHSWSEWEVTTNATCTEDGEKTRTCAVGDATEKEVIPKTGHNWSEWVQEIAPTCTDKGQEKRTCSVCLAEETNPVEATGHDYEEAVTDPTCTTAGEKVYTCGVCGDSYTESIPSLGHSWGAWEQSKAPTCEEDGEQTHKCSRSTCGESETEKIPAIGHSWNEGEKTSDVSCTQNGVVLYTCLNDDSHTKEEVTPATGHDYEEVVIEPTCTEPGYTTYTCSVCGDSYTGAETAATGHDYEEVVTPPTCTDPGTKTNTCSVCRDSYEETLSATGHNPDGDPTFAWAADYGTCTATYTCEACRETQTVSCEVETSLEENKKVFTASVTIGSQKYQNTQEITDIYEITVSWEQTAKATYSAGTISHIWNPRTMTYSSQTQGEGWTGESIVQISIDNTKSNNGVMATFAYEPVIDGTISWSELTDAQKLVLESGASGSAGLTVKPTGIPAAPAEGSDAIILGTITITLEKES